MARVFLAGFPHSDTCGSKDVCSSPQLFAAYHVFHRLLVPRHPPCALISLTLLYIKNIALPFIYLLSFMTALFKTNLAFSVKFLDVWLIYIYIYKLSLTVYSFQGTTTCHYTAWHAGQLGCPSLATGTMPAATDRQPGVCLFSFYISFLIWQPPALPCRHQHSTIGRPGLNHRVRDGYGCAPWAHRHQIFTGY